MFSEKDLVERSVEEMASEVKQLLEEADRLREEHEAMLQDVMLLRNRSVEMRPSDASQAEKLWLEAEELQESAKENLRLSMEKRLRAADVQHRIDIHDQIESMDSSEDVWKRAARAGRS
jgi:uncharacterized protein Yka (UPF0111/DUF47 family)